MAQTGTALLVEILQRERHSILDEWVKLQLDSAATRRDLISDAEIRQQSHEFLSIFVPAALSGEGFHASSSTWAPVREVLTRISEIRARQGFTPTETAA